MPITDQKVKIARDLNTKYNVFCAERSEHDKKWEGILEVCAQEGISPDLIQIAPDVFNFIIDKGVAKQYFL